MRHTTAVAVLIFIFAIAASAEATIFEVGGIKLTGMFTLNPSYDFNAPPTNAPFGTFSNLDIVQTDGLFAPLVTTSDTLVMNTPNVYSPCCAPPVRPSMIWSVGGFTFTTTLTNIIGADSGRFVLGIIDISGNGFNPADYPFGAFSSSSFIAPPYDISNFHTPITGPINLRIDVAYDDHIFVPEASTIVYLAVSIMGMIVLRSALARHAIALQRAAQLMGQATANQQSDAMTQRGSKA